MRDTALPGAAQAGQRGRCPGAAGVAAPAEQQPQACSSCSDGLAIGHLHTLDRGGPTRIIGPHERANTALAGEIIPGQLGACRLDPLEVGAKREQARDVAVELVDLLGEHAEHALARGEALIPRGEDLGKVPQANAQASGAGDKAEPLDIGLVIAPVVVGRSLRADRAGLGALDGRE